MPSNDACYPTPVRTRASPKTPMRIVGFDTSPTSVTEASWRDEALPTPHTAESFLARELSRDRRTPQLSVVCPSRDRAAGMKKCQSSIELCRQQNTFEPLSYRQTAASLAGSPPESQPSSCGSQPIRIPCSPFNMRRKHSMRSIHTESYNSYVDQTLPSSGQLPPYPCPEDQELADCPPTCVATVTHFLPSSSSASTYQAPQLPQIYEAAPDAEDMGVPDEYGLGVPPTLLASKPVWPVARRHH